MRLSDSTRRGLRTAIDVILSAITSGLLLLLINVFKEPDLTAAEFTTLSLALTPVLSVIKNALEDKFETSLLVSKTRPEPDPNEGFAAIQPTESEIAAFEDSLTPQGEDVPPPMSEQIVFGQVPPGYVLVAIPAEEVSEADDVMGFTR